MKLRCDSATTTGYGHLIKCNINQDYCMSGIDPHFGGDMAYAIVSDGCSTGGDTDIGSRLMCMAARSFFKKSSDRSSFTAKSFTNFLGFNLTYLVNELELNRSDLYATCLVARADKDFVDVLVLGDGVVAFQTESGKIDIIKFDWSGNAPLYPVYKDDDIASLVRNTGLVLTKTTMTVSPGGEATTSEETINHFDYLPGMMLSVPSSGITNVGVFSDGVCQVQSPEGQNLPLERVVSDLLAFKSYEGVFAKRKLVNSFLPQSLKHGYRPQDDLTYSVIHLTEDQNG